MTTPPHRRRFRFSLRAFFVVVAVLAIPCAWVAREAAVVRERKAVLKWLYEQPQIGFPPNSGDSAKYWCKSFEQSTWWRRWLGEEFVLFEMQFPRSATAKEIDRVKAAFPEASVEQMPDWLGTPN